MGFVSGIDAYRDPAVDPEEGTSNGSSGRKPPFRGSPHRSTVNSEEPGSGCMDRSESAAGYRMRTSFHGSSPNPRVLPSSTHVHPGGA